MADKLGSAGLAMRFVLIRFDMADEIRYDVMRCYGFCRAAMGCAMADMIVFAVICLDRLRFDLVRFGRWVQIR